MTELDLEIPGLATDLINEYGKTAPYTLRQTGTYDTTTSRAMPVEKKFDVKCVLEPFKGQGFNNQSLVEAGDMKCYIPQSYFEGQGKPSSGDGIRVDGDNYRIVNAQAIFSGELVALWEMIIRVG